MAFNVHQRAGDRHRCNSPPESSDGQLAARPSSPTASSIAVAAATLAGPSPAAKVAGHVLCKREMRQDVECLGTRSPTGRGASGERVVVEHAEFDLVEPHRAAIGLVETGKQVEEGGLADPGFTGHRHILACLETQREAINHHTTTRPAETARQIDEFEHSASLFTYRGWTGCTAQAFNARTS